MDANLTLGIASAALTVAFGAWGVYLAVRTRYPGRISVVIQDNIPLFEQIVESVEGLAVSFRGKPVQPGVTLLKLAFVNEGTTDISPAMVEQRITLALPENYEWLAASVPSSSPDVTSAVNLQPQIATLELGLFRRGEFVRVDLIGQAVSALDTRDRLYELLTMSHRIQNLQTIRIRYFQPDPRVAKRLRWATIILAAGVVLTSFIMLDLFKLPMPGHLEYFAVTDGARSEWVEVLPRADGNVSIMPISGRGSSRTLPASVFYTTRVRQARSVPTDRFELTFTITMVAVYVGIPALFAAVFLYQHFRDRKMQSLLAGKPSGLHKAA